MSKTIIWVVIAAIVLVGAYLLGRAPVEVGEEEALADVEYLLDDSVFSELDGVFNEMLLSSGLDKEALAAEAAELENLPEGGAISELDQYLVEVGQ